MVSLMYSANSNGHHPWPSGWAVAGNPGSELTHRGAAHSSLGSLLESGPSSHPNPSRGTDPGAGLDTHGTHWAAIGLAFPGLGLRVGHGEAAWRAGHAA